MASCWLGKLTNFEGFSEKLFTNLNISIDFSITCLLFNIIKMCYVVHGPYSYCHIIKLPYFIPAWKFKADYKFQSFFVFKILINFIILFFVDNICGMILLNVCK